MKDGEYIPILRVVFLVSIPIDQAGRLMGESKAMNYEKMEFDFSGYIPGMYIIEIRSDKYIEKKKLIIKR